MFKLLLQVICVVRAVCKKALEAPYSGRQKSFEPCNHLNITIYVQSATAVTVAILAQGTTHGPMRSRRPFLTPDQFRQRNPALCRLSVNIGLYLPVSTSICQYLPVSICQWQNTSVCLSNRPLPPPGLFDEPTPSPSGFFAEPPAITPWFVWLTIPWFVWPTTPYHPLIYLLVCWLHCSSTEIGNCTHADCRKRNCAVDDSIGAS